MVAAAALALGLVVAPVTSTAQTTPTPLVPPEVPVAAPQTALGAPVSAERAVLGAIPHENVQGAVREVTGQCVTDEAKCNPPTTPPAPARQPWAYCEQWHDLAAEVGWPESAGPVLSYVLHRESNCDPNAHNPSGATGLMQLLGWSCEGGCTNPRGNLKKGLELWQSSGWRPWCLNGDKVTGHC